jgi:hypothetical protein
MEQGTGQITARRLCRRSTVNGQRSTLLLLLSACGVTPLTNKIDVGTEAFVIGVGEASDGMTDLFAASAAGGTVSRVTFNRLQEQKPRLSGSGTHLVFLRSSPVETAEPEPEIVRLDLRSMAERVARLPREAGRAIAAAWLPGDSVIAVRTDGAIWSLSAPLASSDFTRLTGADSARADSALVVLLGDPPMAMVVDCGGGPGVCVRATSGETSTLDSSATSPLRWGADSIAYSMGGTVTVRPLAGGRSRTPPWRGAPASFRELSYHPGAPNPTPSRSTSP